MTKRVLIVDDSSAARGALRPIVEGFGFAVEEAPDGVAALQQLKSATFEGRGAPRGVVVSGGPPRRQVVLFSE